MTAMRLTTLANGLRVATHSMPDLQTAAVGLFTEVGSRDEPAALNGIAHLFEHMVFKGAGGRSARDLNEAIEEVGGDLNASTERDATNFTATVMAEHVPLAVELISDMILRPHFAEIDLEREKDVVFQELAEARDTPSDMERKKAAGIPTFRKAAETVHTEHKSTWRNAKHREQWIRTLEAYAFPAFGDRSVGTIDTAAVRDALVPIWLTKPETARRLRQRIRTVIDWAVAKGYREHALAMLAA